jgi:hypothetical protein
MRTETVYNKIQISITTRVKEGGPKKWEKAEKGALCTTFFPMVQRRLNIEIPITPEFTAIVSDHRKTNTYLHRFKLTVKPVCPCNEREQTVEHLINVCRILKPQRRSMLQHITTRGGI